MAAPTVERVTIGDSFEHGAFIYLNPNNGQFQDQYFNGTNVTQNLVITLYDEKAHGYT